MLASINSIALIVRFSPEGLESGIKNAAIDIAQFLKEKGKSVFLEEMSAHHMGTPPIPTISKKDIISQIQMVVVIGGDGTTISTAREIMGKNIPIVGINYGKLGFINDIRFENWRRDLTEILEGNYSSDYRTALNCRIIRDGTPIYHASCLNDVVIWRGINTRVLEWEVEVDGIFMVATRGDGFIVATPSGSTAYSLSAGGPILHPYLPGLVLTTIASHTLGSRPIVVPEDSTINIKVTNHVSYSLGFDVNIYDKMQRNDIIEVKAAQDKALFWHPKNWNYYQTLRKKLYWHSLPLRNSHKTQNQET